MESVQALNLIEWACGAWSVLGVIALLGWRTQVATRWVFPLSALVAVAVAWVSLQALTSSVAVATWSLWPGVSGHLRLDALSAWFTLMLGGVVMACSMYAASYFRHREAIPAGLIAFYYHFFVVSMCLILVADDAWLFLLNWEIMAVSSYLLVISNHADAATRRAGLLYLAMAHLGALALLIAMAMITAAEPHGTLAALAPGKVPVTVVFVLALIGFAGKAGLLPLHVWLPEAHPAAPSPVSALMSGLMLKMALYGLLRMVFVWLPALPLMAGVALLILGMLSALFAVIYAAVQVDMKRLLAYSSMENMGLMLLSVGLAMIFRSEGMPSLAQLALLAALYLAMSHALFKSLLFLVTGSVLHATGERNLGHLGGLMRRMPWTAALALIGIFSAAGTPLFGGFAAEWMLLQSFLFTPHLSNPTLELSLPVLSATLVLISALAAYTMVKFFAIIFLGQFRENKLAAAVDARARERWAMLSLAFGCIVMGVAPAWILPHMHAALALLLGPVTHPAWATSSWLVTPIALQRASYAPALLLPGLWLVAGLIWLVVRFSFPHKTRRAPLWDCGFPWQSARMQDTAEGFGQPIRHIFEPVMSLRRHLPEVDDRHPFYRVAVIDRFWLWIYRPLLRTWRTWQRLQMHGRTSLVWYLGMSFATLIVLLGMVMS